MFWKNKGTEQGTATHRHVEKSNLGLDLQVGRCRVFVLRKRETFMQIALMMEAASTSETSINFYHTTRRSIPEDSHIHTCRRESLKS
jgi:hypothetical protein